MKHDRPGRGRGRGRKLPYNLWLCLKRKHCGAWWEDALHGRRAQHRGRSLHRKPCSQLTLPRRQPCTQMQTPFWDNTAEKTWWGKQSTEEYSLLRTTHTVYTVTLQPVPGGKIGFTGSVTHCCPLCYVSRHRCDTNARKQSALSCDLAEQTAPYTKRAQVFRAAAAQNAAVR